MRKLVGIFGWVSSTLGVICLLVCPLTLLDHSGDKNAVFGFAMFADIFGLPGGIILYRERQRQKEDVFHRQLVGFVKSYDSFTVEELARKIGKNEMETELLVSGLIQEDGLELAFHRRSRQYLHKNRIKRGHRVLSRCSSCGASTASEIIFEDEEANCQYCGQPLA